jgi:hypothetical protein
LREVVVDVYEDEKVIHSTPGQVKTLTVGDAFVSSFTYFSKTEKEKRMLVRLRKEQEKVQVFLDLITRPLFRAEITAMFSIDDDYYYDILVMFNAQNSDAHYLKDQAEIRKRIISFFNQMISGSMKE